jgi:hypothetical protein
LRFSAVIVSTTSASGCFFRTLKRLITGIDDDFPLLDYLYHGSGRETDEIITSHNIQSTTWSTSTAPRHLVLGRVICPIDSLLLTPAVDLVKFSLVIPQSRTEGSAIVELAPRSIIQGSQEAYGQQTRSPLRQYQTIAFQVLLQGSTSNLTFDLFSLQCNLTSLIITRSGSISRKLFKPLPPSLPSNVSRRSTQLSRHPSSRFLYTVCSRSQTPSC